MSSKRLLINKKQIESLKDLEKVTEATPDEESGVERTKGRWMAIGDILAILSLLAIVTVSIAVILTTFVATKRKWDYLPYQIELAKAGLAPLTGLVLSTILRLLSQRYVYAKLSNRGLRSRRVAHFNNWTVPEFLNQIFTLKFEPLGALLLVIWLLAVATGLTVRDSLTVDHPTLHDYSVSLPSGPLDPGESSLVIKTFSSIDFLSSAIVTGGEGSLGYIDMADAYDGQVFYPPLDLNGSFYSDAAFLNGLQVNVSHPLSVPSSAYKLDCAQAYGSSTEIWSLSNTTKSISFIHAVQVEGGFNYTQVDATAIGLSGLLVFHSWDYGSSFFQKNGTVWSLEMNDNRWAAQLMDVVCSTVLSDSVSTLGRTLFDLGTAINQRYSSGGDKSPEKAWASAMGTAIGAFSAVKWGSAPTNTTNNGPPPTIKVDLQVPGTIVIASYGIYVLVANTIVSIGLLFALWRLFRASPLDKDFMDPTRLLLGPLNDRQLFNATLDQTIVKLENPYLQVVSDHQLLVTTTKSPKKKGEDSTKEKGEDSIPPLIVEI
ncbi:hypothetical protein FRC17_011107 [Serendipita sp. 399]|nr:hypothetical protein FRC17_011107 [Serendipita sp. 399]